MKYMIITEIHENGKVERWFYDTCADRDSANEIARELGSKWPVFHRVIAADVAEAWGVQNLPG